MGAEERAGGLEDWLKLQVLEKGGLSVIEALKHVPFEIKRLFCIANQPPEARRGCHAHTRLTEAVVCLRGRCTFMLDNGVQRQEIVLDDPSRALLIRPMTWLEFYGFTPDCILLVLCDAPHDDSESMRDYAQFQAATRSKGS